MKIACDSCDTPIPLNVYWRSVDYTDSHPDEPPPAHIAVTAGDFTPAPDMPPEPTDGWAPDDHIGFHPTKDKP